jgi:hypothetical protein
MSKAAGCLGTILFLALIVHQACRYGTWWEFGRYGMPRSLVAADGRSHPDGTTLDPVTEAIYRSGHEEEAWLACLAFFVVAGAYGVYVNLVVPRRTKAVFDREIRRLDRLAAEERMR